MHFVGFPHFGKATNLTLANGNTAMTRGNVKAGWVYRVVSDIDCWMNFEAAAAVGTGMFIPAKTPLYLTFGNPDMEGTQVEVNVYAGGAGNFNCVPIMRTSVFG